MSPKRPETRPQVVFIQARTSPLPMREIRSLQRDGYDAGWRGRPVTDCPFRYDPRDPNAPHDQQRARAWLTGYSAARTDSRIHRRSTPLTERQEHGEPGRF